MKQASPPRIPTLLAILAAVLGVAGGCGEGGGPGSGRSATPSIVFVSIDTLRSDHLPAYGYQGVATPAIDALRRDAVLFERAWSQAPTTAPSHASIFTGRLPTTHRLRDNVGYTLDTRTIPTLPRLLQARGYATGGAISAFVLRGNAGFSTGFDFYDDRIESRVSRGVSGLQRPGGETLDRALSWLRTVADRPFFLFLHLYEPHEPYTPPEPYRSRYALPYDGEIAAADQVVGELVAELRRLGVYEDSLVVLFSDHGEGLGEFGEHGHGIFLYRHDLQVPLLLKLPGGRQAGLSVAAPARLVDLLPTVLEIIGAPAPPGVQGASLLALLGEEPAPRPAYAETYVPRLHFGWSELTSLVEDRYHYIHGPDPELYDLAADAEELQNLAADQPERCAAMGERLAALTVPLQTAEEGDEESRRKLAALGYFGTAPADLSGPLPDPKAMIHTLDLLQEGLELFKQSRPEEAAAALRRAVDANPDFVDGWDYLGRAYQQLRKHEEALQAFREAMRLSGGRPELAVLTAMSLLEVGEPDEALLVLEHQAAQSPDNVQLRVMQVRVLLTQKRVEEAEERAADLLRRAPDDCDAHYLVATVRMARGDSAGAEREFRRALELEPDHEATLFDLALFLAKDGRPAEAETLLEKLVTLRPNNRAAAAQLARVRRMPR